ncbi:MAG: hypothetical protein HKN26_10460 [Acidimicrobiales bacterium]|nr:hypothetical protein [Acidimicrobiales bacterium]
MLAGPLSIAALVVVLGGALKLGSPDATQRALATLGLPSHRLIVQAMGAAEVALGAAVLAIGGRVPAFLLALAYLAFTGFVVVAQRAGSGIGSCGCFGQTDTPPSAMHVVVNLAAAGVAFAAVAWPVPGLADTLADQPWLGGPFLGLSLLGTWIVYLLLTTVAQALNADQTVAVKQFRLRQAGTS